MGRKNCKNATRTRPMHKRTQRTLLGWDLLAEDIDATLHAQHEVAVGLSDPWRCSACQLDHLLTNRYHANRLDLGGRVCFGPTL